MVILGDTPYSLFPHLPQIISSSLFLKLTPYQNSKCKPQKIQLQIFAPWIPRSSTIASPTPDIMASKFPRVHPHRLHTAFIHKRGMFQLFIWLSLITSAECFSEPGPDLYQCHFPQNGLSILQYLDQVPPCISLPRPTIAEDHRLGGLTQQKLTFSDSWRLC